MTPPLPLFAPSPHVDAHTTKVVSSSANALTSRVVAWNSAEADEVVAFQVPVKDECPIVDVEVKEASGSTTPSSPDKASVPGQATRVRSHLPRITHDHTETPTNSQTQKRVASPSPGGAPLGDPRDRGVAGGAIGARATSEGLATTPCSPSEYDE